MSANNSEFTPIGKGHASAMLRMGLGELRNAMYSNSSIAQKSEYGLYGTMTPGEVAEGRRADERDLDEEPVGEGIISERIERAERQAAEPERDTREMDLDKE